MTDEKQKAKEEAAAEKARVKEEAQIEKARAVLEAEAKASEKAATKAAATIEAEAERLGVKKSVVHMSSFDVKNKTPEKINKEEARHKKLVAARLKNRVAKAKALAKMKPIDKRKALLKGRFRAVRNRTRAHTYTNKMIAAWTEEYELIIHNPKQWNSLTHNGTKPYTPGNKKKMTAKERLDGMNLDDDVDEKDED